MYSSNKKIESDFLSSYSKVNVIPHHWYQQICTKSGKADHISISLLAEIIYWYRPTKHKTNNHLVASSNKKFAGDSWQTSYQYFEKKFGYHRESIRRAFVRLEELGLIIREFKTVQLRGQNYNNVLFIHLNQEKFNLSHNSASYNQVPIEHKTESIYLNSKKISDPLHEKKTPSPQIVGDIIDKENNTRSNRSRSDESLGNEFKEVLGRAKLKISCKQTKVFTRRKIADYIPLEEELYQKICSKTFRQYPISFVNKLLEKLSVRCEYHRFINEEYFIAYMVKVLDNELMSEGIVNTQEHSSADTSIQEKGSRVSLKEKELYLNMVENSKDTSRVGQLKRKIAGRFNTDNAYYLLKNFVFSEKTNSEELGLSEEGYTKERNSYTIKFIGAHIAERFDTKEHRSSNDLNGVGLPERTASLLLVEIQSIFGQDIEQLLIKTSKKVPETIFTLNVNDQRDSQTPTSTREADNKGTGYNANSVSIESESDEDQGIWARARKVLRERYGRAVDTSWFSKLDFELLEEVGVGRIIAPTNFHRDWVKSNYFQSITKAVKNICPEINHFEI